MTGMTRALYLSRRVRMRLSLPKIFAFSVSLLLILSGAAFADTCVAVGAFSCAKGNHDGAFIGGSGTAIGGGGAGLLLNSNMFTVGDHNGTGGSDVIIIAAVLGSSGPTGTLNGVAFNSLNSLPSDYTGAIAANLQATGFCTGSACSSLSFGYVDLGVALPSGKGSTITVTASGVGAGTALYAEIVGANGQIILTTANSNSGVLGGTSTVPEPGSLSLLVTGLFGVAGGAWRKLRG